MGELTENFVLRMRNWARSRVGSSLSYAAVNLESFAGGGYREASVPILNGEADDTDAALLVLPIRYRQAVQLYWAWEQTELVVLARKCGGIDVRTFVGRVRDGHGLLRGELARRAEAWRERAAACEAVVKKYSAAY